jgi:hypothetical protein
LGIANGEAQLKAFRFLIVPVLAGAILLYGTNTAQAVQTAPPSGQASFTSAEADAIQARAVQIGEAVVKSLQTTGAAEFTGADGRVHQMRLAGRNLTVDGRIYALGAPESADAGTSPDDWWCNVKVAAAVTTITALGAVFIFWMIAGLPLSAVVVIGGIALTAGTWSTIAAILAAGGALAPFLHTVLC